MKTHSNSAPFLKILSTLSSVGRAVVLYTTGPWFESRRVDRIFKSHTIGPWFESRRVDTSLRVFSRADNCLSATGLERVFVIESSRSKTTCRSHRRVQAGSCDLSFIAFRFPISGLFLAIPTNHRILGQLKESNDLEYGCNRRCEGRGRSGGRRGRRNGGGGGGGSSSGRGGCSPGCRGSSSVIVHETLSKESVLRSSTQIQRGNPLYFFAKIVPRGTVEG